MRRRREIRYRRGFRLGRGKSEPSLLDSTSDRCKVWGPGSVCVSACSCGGGCDGISVDVVRCGAGPGVGTAVGATGPHCTPSDPAEPKVGVGGVVSRWCGEGRCAELVRGGCAVGVGWFWFVTRESTVVGRGTAVTIAALDRGRGESWRGKTLASGATLLRRERGVIVVEVVVVASMTEAFRSLCAWDVAAALLAVVAVSKLLRRKRGFGAFSATLGIVRVVRRALVLSNSESKCRYARLYVAW